MNNVRACVLAVTVAGSAGIVGAQTQTSPAPPVATSVVVQNTMAQRMQACAVCHGKEGRATHAGYFPRIAGKPEGYLFNQLQNFKVGRRRNEAMNHLVQHMSDDYLRSISRYFSQLDLPSPPAQQHGMSPEQVEVARTLVFKGDPQRKLPACVSCHGEQMAGMLPAMPGLLTLPADYLVSQLGGWRTDQRRAHEPDCMGEVARKLLPEEIATVSRWLSAQTLPTGTKPAPASTTNLPLKCGSGLQ